MPQAQNLIIKICAIILAWFGKNIETTDTQEEMYSLGVYFFYCTVWKKYTNIPKYAIHIAQS